jgi:hypothetical protein
VEAKPQAQAEEEDEALMSSIEARLLYPQHYFLNHSYTHVTDVA